MWQMMEKWIVAEKGETVLDVVLDATIALLGASILTKAFEALSASSPLPRSACTPN